MDFHEKHGEMTGKNWAIFFLGLVIFFIGFFVMSLVKTDYHGFLGFFAPALLIGGLIVMVWGFLTTRRSQ